MRDDHTMWESVIFKPFVKFYHKPLTIYLKKISNHHDFQLSKTTTNKNVVLQGLLKPRFLSLAKT